MAEGKEKLTIPVMAMGNCSWDFITQTLSETEIKRFACCYLNIMEDKSVNLQAAAAAFGSASANSFRVTVYGTIKKLKAATSTAGLVAHETTIDPATEPKKKPGRPPKRQNGNEHEPEKSAKKAKGKMSAPVVKPEDSDDDNKSEMITPPTTPNGTGPPKKNGSAAVRSTGKKVTKIGKKGIILGSEKDEDDENKARNEADAEMEDANLV